MKSLSRIIITALLTTATSTANAIFIDFKAGADGVAVNSLTGQNLGEKGYSTLSYALGGGATLDITGSSNADDDLDQFAYMDSNKAGLGVCKDITTSLQCTPPSDDNVTGGTNETEVLHFLFSTDVIINKIWFNNNHDPDRSLVGDTITIGSDNYMFGLGDIDASRSSGSTNAYGTGFARTDFVYIAGISGTSLDIAFFNEQFYVSAIDFDIPEPGPLALIAIGLIGIGVMRRRS